MLRVTPCRAARLTSSRQRQHVQCTATVEAPTGSWHAFENIMCMQKLVLVDVKLVV